MLSLELFKKHLAESGKVNWISNLNTEFLWCYELNASKEQIWNYLSDTSRLNREMGVPAREQVEKNGKVSVTTKMLGFDQAWIEDPWTWIENETLTSVRHYTEGLAETMQSVFYIDAETNPHKRLVYIYFGWKPANPLWKLFFKFTEKVLKDGFAKALAKMDHAQAFTVDSVPQIFKVPKPILSPVVMVSIAEHKLKLLQLRLPDSSVERLIEWVTEADEMDLEPIRALPIARAYGLKEQEFLSTCLHATRNGLLKMSWDVICPHCRGSRFSAQSLGDLPAHANCEICDIEFNTDEDQSIEVLFHVHPSIRNIQTQVYCAAEPAKKKHIKFQHRIESGKFFQGNLNFAPGVYRARVIGNPGQVLFSVANDHQVTHLTFDHFSSDPAAGVLPVSPSFQFHFQNSEPETVTLILEELKWSEQGLRPSQILSLPEFRDLFSEQHLSSNVKLYLGEQTILFTDIVASTKFYQSKGDATAFAEVRAHFQEVFGEVRRHHGVVVKTIGDSVMASFASPADALVAAVRIQEKFPLVRGDTAIRLRISVHAGPVIAVQLNSGLDYFGNTVNLAAKIQSCSAAGEIAISERLFREYEKTHLQHAQIQKRQNLRDGGATDVYVLQNPAAALHVKKAA